MGFSLYDLEVCQPIVLEKEVKDARSKILSKQIIYVQYKWVMMTVLVMLIVPYITGLF